MFLCVCVCVFVCTPAAIANSSDDEVEGPVAQSSWALPILKSG